MATITTVNASAQRVSDATLHEIRQRMLEPLNDDGLRAWYSHDVGTLLQEVLVLRGVLAGALANLKANPALADYPATDLLQATSYLTERWQEVRSGVWQKAEVKRLRQELKDSQDAVGELEQRLNAAANAAASASAERDQLEARLIDTVADASQRDAEQRKADAERVGRVEGLLLQAAAALRADL